VPAGHVGAPSMFPHACRDLLLLPLTPLAVGVAVTGTRAEVTTPAIWYVVFGGLRGGPGECVEASEQQVDACEGGRLTGERLHVPVVGLPRVQRLVHTKHIEQNKVLREGCGG
jgi:hypothetical protein